MLSAPFPITKASYRRKFLRDLTGQTGYEQRKAQILNALGDPAWPMTQRLRLFAEKLGPQIAANAALFAGLALAGVWWAYPLLWLVPLLTWQMVITRVRNIAEHAVIPDSDDPLTHAPRLAFFRPLLSAAATPAPPRGNQRNRPLPSSFFKYTT